jgi:hypothetical protein
VPPLERVGLLRLRALAEDGKVAVRGVPLGYCGGVGPDGAAEARNFDATVAVDVKPPEALEKKKRPGAVDARVDEGNRVAGLMDRLVLRRVAGQSIIILSFEAFLASARFVGTVGIWCIMGVWTVTVGRKVHAQSRMR